MNKIIKNEFNVPADERYPEDLSSYSEKPTDMTKEFSASIEINIPDDEFNNSYVQKNEEKKSDRLKQMKRMIFAPVACSIAVVSIVFSSFGYDPLGKDIFNSDTTASVSDNVTETEEADTEFPALPNMAPDFAGEYAWSGQGSEEYIMFWSPTSDTREYLHIGTFFASTGSYDSSGNFIQNQVTTLPDAWYDINTNTLTLDNFTGEVLEVNLMGNGFTVNLIGENHLDELSVWGAGYGGSVTFTGTGSLTLNKNKCAPDNIGILIHGENSASCVMIDKDVTLDIYGDYTIFINSTTMKKAIYYMAPLQLTGGKRECFDFGETFYNHTIVDEEGNRVHHVRFAPQN